LETAQARRSAAKLLSKDEARRIAANIRPLQKQALDLDQSTKAAGPYKAPMPTFLYRCPNTGFRVQGYAPEQTSDDDVYEVMTCTMCKRVHLVSPTTGKVLGEDEE
jgi:hypothetical protein